MIYELRTYEAVPGKLPALHTRLEVAAGLFKKNGLGALGFWTDEIGTLGQVTYMWIYDSLEDRGKKVAAFTSDPIWKQQDEAAEKEGPIIARAHNTMMQLTHFSPEPKISTKIQELRIYEAMPGRMPDLQTRFANHTMGLFERHGMENIGYWTELFGTSSRLVYMLGYASLADREKSWDSFRKDPEWHKAQAESLTRGPITSTMQNRILRPTPYSFR